MKKRKVLLSLTLVSAMVFGVASCKKKNNSSVDPDPDPDPIVEVDSYTVTFDNGTSTSTVDVKKGEKVQKPADPTKAEDSNNTYEFVCWCKDSSLTTEFDFANETINSAITIYAKFNAVSKDTKIKMNGTEYDTIAAALAAIPTTSTTIAIHSRLIITTEALVLIPSMM